MKPPAKKITRVFVARIPPSVTDDVFRRYFSNEQIALNAEYCWSSENLRGSDSI